MPSKTSKKKPAVTLPAIPKDIIDQFVSGPMTAEAVNAASMAFKKALIERALGAELSHHHSFFIGSLDFTYCSIPPHDCAFIELSNFLPRFVARLYGLFIRRTNCFIKFSRNILHTFDRLGMVFRGTA